MKANTNQRDLGLDIIRSLAICFIILIHVMWFPQRLGLDALIPLFINVFAKTGVPLFFITSGYLLLDNNLTYFGFYKKRATRVLLPWIFWSVLSVAFMVLDLQVPINWKIIDLFLKTLSNYWFIPVMLGIYFISPLLKIFVQNAKNNEIVYLLIIWFLVFSLIPYIHVSTFFPRDDGSDFVRKIIMFSGYYILGGFIKKFNAKNIHNLYYIFITIGVLISFFGNIFVSQKNNDILMTNFTNNLSPGVILTSIGLFILIMKIGNNYKPKKKISLFFHNLGASSLGVYLSHYLILGALVYYAKNWFFTNYSLVNSMLVFIIVLLISFLLIYVLKKIPLLAMFIN